MGAWPEGGRGKRGAEPGGRAAPQLHPKGSQYRPVRRPGPSEFIKTDVLTPKCHVVTLLWELLGALMGQRGAPRDDSAPAAEATPLLRCVPCWGCDLSRLHPL